MNSNKLIYLLFIAVLQVNILSTQTKVIAHRGHWDCEGSAQNSIFALQKAQELKIYGSEFDVWMTSDGVLVIDHDGVFEGQRIENLLYNQIKNIRLSNGEQLSTLEEYLIQGGKDKQTKLVLELKPHGSKEKEDRAVAAIVELVEKTGVKDQTEYISFSLNICKEFVRLSPDAAVAYLSGNLAPSELKALNISGIDYNLRVLQENKHWIEEAHNVGMTVNVWTVNREEDMQEMIASGVDFITTDQPGLANRLIQSGK